MEASKQTSHFEAVADILSDGEPLTDEQHFSVVNSGLREKLQLWELKQAVQYSRENIGNPDLLASATLQIAERAIENNQNEFYGRSSEDNQSRIDMAIDIASATLDSEKPVGESLLCRAFGLIGTMRQIDGLKHHHHQYRWYSHTLNNRGESKRKITELGSRFIERARQSENPATILGAGLHWAYGNQILWLRQAYDPNTETGKYKQVGELVEKAMDSIDVDTKDAVDFCLDILSDQDSYRIPNRQLVRDKVLDITKNSSRETVVEEKKSRFGFTRHTKSPSPFVSRRGLLKSYVDKSFLKLIDEDPNFVKEFVGLYGEDEQEALWEFYSKTVASVGFTNGNYSAYEVKNMQSALDRFATVAPGHVMTKTKSTVKERLARSTIAH